MPEIIGGVHFISILKTDKSGIRYHNP